MLVKKYFSTSPSGENQRGIKVWPWDMSLSLAPSFFYSRARSRSFLSKFCLSELWILKKIPGYGVKRSSFGCNYSRLGVWVFSRWWKQIMFLLEVVFVAWKFVDLVRSLTWSELPALSGVANIWLISNIRHANFKHIYIDRFYWEHFVW
jgi:hypothetical protein